MTFRREFGAAEAIGRGGRTGCRAAAIATIAALFTAAVPVAAAKPRTIVTTDIETDDYNTMIRYLLYTNEVETVGIVYTSSRYHWAGDGKGTVAKDQNGKPQTSWRWTGTHHIQELIGEYAKSYRNLRAHDRDYPTPRHLLDLIKMGNVEFEGDMSADTEGSDWIKAKLLDGTPGPLFLQAWGGTNSIARALKSIEESSLGRPGWEALKRMISGKAVIYSWGRQDRTYDEYISKNWPEIQFNDISQNAWGYWVLGEKSTNVLPQDKRFFETAWTRANVLEKGPLGARYRVWGDGRQLEGDQDDTFGKVPYPRFPLPLSLPPGHFISEGDTPTYLNLLANGLRAYENPSFGGWGNRLVRSGPAQPNYWVAAADERDDSGHLIPNYTSKRWVRFAQQDFAARLQWMVTQRYAGANHPPVVQVARLDRTARPGERVSLGGRARDPDRDRLTYRWWQYLEAGSYPHRVQIFHAERSNAGFVVPLDAQQGQTIHLLFEVTDDGSPALTRWQRVIVTVSARR